MSAKDLSAAAVEKGMSIRGAAQVFGINFSTLQNHIAMQNRPSFTDAKQKEALIVAALESVAENSIVLSFFGCTASDLKYCKEVIFTGLIS